MVNTYVRLLREFQLPYGSHIDEKLPWISVAQHFIRGESLGIANFLIAFFQCVCFQALPLEERDSTARQSPFGASISRGTDDEHTHTNAFREMSLSSPSNERILWKQATVGGVSSLNLIRWLHLTILFLFQGFWCFFLLKITEKFKLNLLTGRLPRRKYMNM